MKDAKENLELFKEFGNKAYENLNALGQLNLRTWERLAERQLGTFGLLVDSGMRQIQLTSETKELKELIEGQVELTKQLNEELTSRGRESLEFTRELQEEYKAWFEQGVSSLTGKIEEMAEKAA